MHAVCFEQPNRSCCECRKTESAGRKNSKIKLMKQLFSLALVAVIAFVVVGCKNEQDKAAEAAQGAVSAATNAVTK